MSSYRSEGKHLSNALREEQAKRNYERHIDAIHQAVNTGRDQLAIMLLLEHYEDYQGSLEVYEAIYQEMLKWKHTRTILCLSRLLISEYIKQQKYARAVEIAKTAYAITPQFVFAEEGDRKLLVVMSEKYNLGLPTKDEETVISRVR